MVDQDSSYILVAVISLVLIAYGTTTGSYIGGAVFIANLFAYTWSKKQ